MFSVHRCIEVPSVTNAEYEVTKWIHDGSLLPGTEVRYTCGNNLTMIPENFVGRICEEFGTWKSVPATAVPMCGKSKNMLRFSSGVIPFVVKFIKKNLS